MVSVGDPAPPFSLLADDGSSVALADFAGRRVVVYFYPKDDTAGCTAQACELRDDLPTFSALGVDVIGVSPDSVASHVKFKSKYDLNFPLLSDPEHSMSEAFGVWKEKSMYGRTYMGIERSTFIIDEGGRIAGAWRKVKPRGHAELVRAALSDLF
jgi:peroxiredoxin